MDNPHLVTLQAHRPSKGARAVMTIIFILAGMAGVLLTTTVRAQFEPTDLDRPTGITVASDGSLYLTDTNNHQVLRIEDPTTMPTVTRIAGVPGVAGFSGNNGPAVSARLSAPTGLAIDRLTGNLYISDTGNNIIRQVTPGGDGIVNGGPGEIISTVAGVLRGGCRGPDEGPATRFPLNEPVGIAVDGSRFLYIANTRCGNLLKVDLTTGILTTVAEDLDGPSDVAVDSTGTVFVAETRGNRICQIEEEECVPVVGNGRPTFCGDDVSPEATCLFGPRGIQFGFARGGEGLLIADTFNHRIRLALKTGRIMTIAGSGEIGPGRGGCSGDADPATSARLNSPVKAVTDGQGNLFISDTENNRVRWVDAMGTIRTIVGPKRCP